MNGCDYDHVIKGRERAVCVFFLTLYSSKNPEKRITGNKENIKQHNCFQN